MNDLNTPPFRKSAMACAVSSAGQSNVDSTSSKSPNKRIVEARPTQEEREMKMESSSSHAASDNKLIMPPARDDNDSTSYLDEMLTHSEMCQELGISRQTGYDWRSPKSKRYKPDLAAIAIYLSEKTIRFRRRDMLNFASQRMLGGKP